MDLKLTGKRALICGGSSGLGRAVATALAAEGAHVALLSRNAEALQAVADELNAAGPGRAVVVTADLADHEGLLKAVAVAEAALGGPIQILLNNTGGPPPSGVNGLEPSVWRDHFESMVLSIFRLTDRVLPRMRGAGWGRILNVASITVVEPSAALGVSNTLRASVAAWAKTLANEVGPDGVTVNTLLPGRIDTPRIARLDKAAAERTGVTPEQARAESVKSIPVGRLGAPQEFGATAAFLADQTPGCSVYALGEAGLLNALYDRGITMNDVNPDYVVIGEARAYSLDTLTKATNLVLAGAKLIGANSDTCGPTDEGIAPACRALIAPVEIATGKQAYFCGKPNPLMMRTGLRILGCHSGEAVMIGDRMDTDVISGMESGMATVLVLSGVSTRATLDEFAYRPSVVLDGVGDIPRLAQQA